METETIRFPIAGMTCTSCVNRISRAVRRLDGVERIDIALGAETATIRRDATRATDDAIQAAIRTAGHEPDLSSATVIVTPLVRPSLLHRVLRRSDHPEGRSSDLSPSKPTQETLP